MQPSPKHSKATSTFGFRERAVAFQEWVCCTLRGLPTQPQDKASITPFIIEIDFSLACITKIYPSYFELGMCRSTKITISIQQQGQPKVLMLRDVSCFILISARITNGSAVCTKLPPASQPCLACLQSQSQDLPAHSLLLAVSQITTLVEALRNVGCSIALIPTCSTCTRACKGLFLSLCSHTGLPSELSFPRPGTLLLAFTAFLTPSTVCSSQLTARAHSLVNE